MFYWCHDHVVLTNWPLEITGSVCVCVRERERERGQISSWLHSWLATFFISLLHPVLSLWVNNRSCRNIYFYASSVGLPRWTWRTVFFCFNQPKRLEWSGTWGRAWMMSLRYNWGKACVTYGRCEEALKATCCCFMTVSVCNLWADSHACMATRHWYQWVTPWRT